jgi:predicted naringenin-chalcone synthase
LSKIISIGTAVPAHKHNQKDILQFMQHVYALDVTENRKMKFMYNLSGIDTRYSVVPDYSHAMPEWKFYPHSENLEPFPSIEQRMQWYNKFAAPLSVDAIRNATEGIINTHEITHLITVSCTGMSAPGLDLQVMELLDLPKQVYRTSINFMGCYAAIHGLKMADAICKNEPTAKVMIVCTELCTLHFQKEATADNIASTLLFADGSAAALVTHDDFHAKGLRLNSFYSEVVAKGKRDMAWELSSTGFIMTLSGYIPDLIEEDFEPLVQRALQHANLNKEQISQWCIHPGGKRIVDAIQKSLELPAGALQKSYDVLQQFGNMSSPTILYVLKELMKDSSSLGGSWKGTGTTFGAAFGPGLTMETFTAVYE